MAVPDITGLTLAELEELIANANLAFVETKAEQFEADELRKLQVTAAIVNLQNLLGAEGSTPNLTSIRGVLGYTDAQMAQNSGLAFRLAFQGMEQLTKTLLDLAHVIGK